MLYIIEEVEDLNTRDGFHLHAVWRFLRNETVAETFIFSQTEAMNLLNTGQIYKNEQGNKRIRITMKHTLPANLMALATKKFAMHVETPAGVSDLYVTPEGAL